MGALITYKRDCDFLGCQRIKKAEALAFLVAMTWVHSIGYSVVIFETDCKKVVDALKCNMPNDTWF